MRCVLYSSAAVALSDEKGAAAAAEEEEQGEVSEQARRLCKTIPPVITLYTPLASHILPRPRTISL